MNAYKTASKVERFICIITCSHLITFLSREPRVQHALYTQSTYHLHSSTYIPFSSMICRLHELSRISYKTTHLPFPRWHADPSGLFRCLGRLDAINLSLCFSLLLRNQLGLPLSQLQVITTYSNNSTSVTGSAPPAAAGAAGAAGLAWTAAGAGVGGGGACTGAGAGVGFVGAATGAGAGVVAPAFLRRGSTKGLGGAV